MQIFKSEIEYLGHLVSGNGFSPMKQTVKFIRDLAATTNITETIIIIGLIVTIGNSLLKYLQVCWNKVYPISIHRQAFVASLLQPLGQVYGLI